MSDLTERLRKEAESWRAYHPGQPAQIETGVMLEIAEHIAALEAENDVLHSHLGNVTVEHWLNFDDGSSIKWGDPEDCDTPNSEMNETLVGESFALRSGRVSRVIGVETRRRYSTDWIDETDPSHE